MIDEGIYEINYPSGGVYRGDIQGDLRHGIGRHEWSNGHYYDGSWVHDKMQGVGVLKTLKFLFEG
jgi:hypothetical protein